MSRLAKTVVTEREDFVRSLFRENATLTGSQVQDKLKEKFGKIMRPNRIYALKAEVAIEAVGTTTTPEVVEPLTDTESAGTLGPVVTEMVTTAVDNTATTS